MLEEFREQADAATNFEAEPTPLLIENYTEKRFLGMTAIQRFIISLMLLFIICVLAIACLIVSQKVVPGFLVF